MKPLSPYCPKCRMVAVPKTHYVPCEGCGIGDVAETSWITSCNCNEGLMMPDMADKIVPLEEMPLEVILRRRKAK